MASVAWMGIVLGGLCLGACTRMEQAPGGQAGAGGSTPAPSATPTASSPCPAGSHPGAAGGCEPDAPPAASASASASAAGSAAPAPGRCPEPGNAERLAVFDWAKEMQVSAGLASTLRGVSGTAAELSALGTELETELRATCTRMALELTGQGAFASAEAACQAAQDGLKTTRAKLGPAAKVKVVTHAPVCVHSTATAAECTQRCDGRQVEVTCASGAPVGRCGGACEGGCEGRVPAHCPGVCAGTCDSGFVGTCQGVCTGTCNGKDMRQGGECTGKCEGACAGTAKGDCKGSCRGHCDGKVTLCDGQCEGKCATPIKDPACASGIKIPSADASCGPYCELRAARKGSCSNAIVAVQVAGAKDAAAAKLYERVLESSLPTLLKLDRRLKGRQEFFQKARTSVTEGLKQVTGSGSEALPQITPCLFLYDRAAAEGTSRLASMGQTITRITAAAQGR